MLFNEYAQYYDLLYKDKDYDGEAKYIDALITKYHNKAKKVLDLGCGTGRHAEILSQYGYNIHGVDMSREMLKKALQRAGSNDRLAFTLSNIQKFDLNEEYDIVTALFHVMSYQVTDEAIKNVLLNVYKHLKKDGVFIFDCWYGPSVLTERPEVRVKRLENEKIKITRIAEPVMRENNNIVEVHYDVFIRNKKADIIKEIQETHIMRYLFKKEIEKFASECGFTYIDGFEFMTGKSLSMSTWGSCFVVRKEL